MANFYARYSGIFGGGGSSGGGSINVDENGALVVSNATVLNFIGATVTDAGGGQADITVPSAAAAFQEVPVGVINNVNVTFTLSQAPAQASAFELYQDGLILVQGVDYTLAGSTITMTVAPNFAQTLYAVYSIATGVIGVTDVNGAGGSISIIAGAGISVGTVGGTITITNTGSPGFAVINSRGAPLDVTAVGGISFASLKERVTIYVQGSGGPVTITVNPQIVNSLGNFIGQRLLLIPVSNVNTLTIDPGNGVDTNGTWIGTANNAIEFEFDGTNYYEINRRA